MSLSSGVLLILGCFSIRTFQDANVRIRRRRARWRMAQKRTLSSASLSRYNWEKVFTIFTFRLRRRRHQRSFLSNSSTRTTLSFTPAPAPWCYNSLLIAQTAKLATTEHLPQWRQTRAFSPASWISSCALTSSVKMLASSRKWMLPTNFESHGCGK